ncbi:MAG: flagellar motor switch protein FliN [bacterium]
MADELKNEETEPQVVAESTTKSEVTEKVVENAEQVPNVQDQEVITQDEVIQIDDVESGPDDQENGTNNLDLLMDISLQITAELGRREMKFSEILHLNKGSLIELNKLVDEPVYIYVNQSKVAEGEVVVVDEHFGVRITKILNTARLRRSG